MSVRQPHELVVEPLELREFRLWDLQDRLGPHELGVVVDRHARVVGAVSAVGAAERAVLDGEDEATRAVPPPVGTLPTASPFALSLGAVGEGDTSRRVTAFSAAAAAPPLSAP